MCLVLVGSKESRNSNQQARNSWSTGEMILISKLPQIIKKWLIAAKCMYKHCVQIYRDGNVTGDDRSHVGSYHLKTTFLNHLENTPPSEFTSAFSVMMNVLQNLSTHLRRGNLPHYFLPECNLLTTVGCNERQIGHHFAYNIFKRNVMKVMLIFRLNFSAFVLKVPFYNAPSLVQVMGWPRRGDRLSPERICAQVCDY